MDQAPVEIIEHIVHLVADLCTSVGSKRDLLSISRTCKLLRILVVREICVDVELATYEMWLILSSILSQEIYESLRPRLK